MRVWKNVLQICRVIRELEIAKLYKRSTDEHASNNNEDSHQWDAGARAQWVKAWTRRGGSKARAATRLVGAVEHQQLAVRVGARRRRALRLRGTVSRLERASAAPGTLPRLRY